MTFWTIEGIIRELWIPKITEFIEQYGRDWKKHVDTMISHRIPKMFLKYQPRRKRH